MASPYRLIKLDKIRRDGEWAVSRELVNSMGDPATGQIMPVIVISTNGGFDLMDGRRRVAAAEALGWDKVKAIVCKNRDEAERAKLILAANLHSSNPLSEARALNTLGEQLGPEEAHAVALAVAGMTKGQARARKRLLRLAPEYQDELEQGRLSLLAARELCKLEHEQQRQAYGMAVKLTAWARIQRDRGPTSKAVKRAVRKVRSETRAVISVPLPTLREAAGIDPVVVASAVRELVNRFLASGNVSEEDAAVLLEAALVLEARGGVDDD